MIGSVRNLCDIFSCAPLNKDVKEQREAVNRMINERLKKKSGSSDLFTQLLKAEKTIKRKLTMKEFDANGQLGLVAAGGNN